MYKYDLLCHRSETKCPNINAKGIMLRPILFEKKVKTTRQKKRKKVVVDRTTVFHLGRIAILNAAD